MDHNTQYFNLYQELLQSGCRLRLRVGGRSMRPFLHGGEVVEIEKTPVEQLRPGDLLLCRSMGGGLFLHRLIRTKENNGNLRLLLKGDALNRFDGWLSPAAVLGRVYKIEQNTTARSALLDNPIRCLPARLLVLYSLRFPFYLRMRRVARCIVSALSLRASLCASAYTLLE